MLGILCLTFSHVTAMIHRLDLKSDSRIVVHLTTFGFIQDGKLTVSISNLVPVAENQHLGFTLDKSVKSQQSEILPSWDDRNPNCVLDDLEKEDKKNDSVQVIVFKINFKTELIEIERRGSSMMNLTILETSDEDKEPTVRKRRSPFRDSSLFKSLRKRNAVAPSPQQTSSLNPAGVTLSSSVKQEDTTISSTTTTLNTGVEKKNKVFYESVKTIRLASWPIADNKHVYNASFTVLFNTADEEGLYNLAFHNCEKQPINITIDMVERNGANFLSIGDAPLPIMYFVFCIVYLIVGGLWHWILYVSQEGVYKIHYLMLSLMYIKSVSLLFHGVNIYFMQVKGQKEEALAILFYIVYLLKGIVMFLTIVLIGAGWTFVRHILSDRDKKIFVIVIPLQILVNVAHIVVEESEQGQQSYTLWENLMIFLDLICCAAILFPIVGSIRHLQQASQIDGKAAINLEKLKIFRHFYILVVCFIYFTRIIVLLVGITVPFRWMWLAYFFVEVATFGFFAMTGYKFRPASNNPYLQVSTSDDEEEDPESLTKPGVLENITRVNVKSSGHKESEEPLLKQREASHEYD